MKLQTKQYMGLATGTDAPSALFGREAERDAASAASGEATAPARVVAVEAGRVWLEPMQGTSCGGCASAAMCGAKGVGTVANRLEARRFAVDGSFGLEVGETVEVAFGNENLIKAAAVAYFIPLVCALVAAAVCQSQFGRDGITLLGAGVGLAGGFAIMKFISLRLEAGGALQARIVRRHGQAIRIFPTGA